MIPFLNACSPLGLNTLHQSAERGNDPVQFTKQVVAYFRNVLLMKMDNADRIDVPEDLLPTITSHSDKITMKELLDLIRVFNNAANDRGASWQPTLPLEMAFLEALDTIGGAEPRTKSKPAPKKASQKKPDKQSKAAPSKKAPQKKVETPEKSAESGQEPLTVLQQWKDILERVRNISPSTQGILNSSKPLGIKDKQLVLSFRSDARK